MTRNRCPNCGQRLWRDFRKDHYGMHRFYDRCGTCGDLGWDAAVTLDYYQRGEARRIARRKAEADATMVSGYRAHGPMIDPPDYDYYCDTCHNDPCTCNQPPHEQEYLAVWRDGAFDDDLVGFAEELTYVGFERLVAS